MAPDSSDEQGVLGNLPRSRPGQRSAKRGGGSTAKAAPATRAKVAKAKARTKAKSASSSGTRAKRAPAAAKRPKPAVTAPSERREATRTPPPHSPAQASGDDPVKGAVKVAAKVATIGPRAAIGITKRLLGR